MVAGGVSAGSSVELYNPKTFVWTAAPGLATARSSHTATLLSGGKVLIAGGSSGGPSAAAEVYTPGALPSVGGVAERPDVATLPAAAASSGHDYTRYALGAAAAFAVAATGAVGWRTKRKRW
jgi:hypothetical protein